MMPEAAKPRVLFVDDEPDLLQAMTRGLRSEHFAVATAPGGAAALDMLQHAGPFAVVVSDLNMPGMDGVTLLRLARQTVPETVRVLFTGQPDLERSIAAINEGAIFRFLTKPCSRVSLALTLKAAVEQYRLVTAERVLLEQTLHGSIQALTGILALTNPLAFGRATRLRQTVRSLAAACGVAEPWALEVAAMLSQVGCVILPPATVERVYRGETLSDAEQQMVRRMPEIVEQVLANIPRLEPVQEILRLYNKQPDAGSPGQAAAPWGARALKLALDLDVLESQGTPAAAAFQRLRESPGQYDEEMLDRLAAMRGSEQQARVRQVPLAGLLPGMVLAEDVKTREGGLFAARGQEVTAGLLEKLRNFTSSTGALEEICFVNASLAEASAEAVTRPEAYPAAGSPAPAESPPCSGEAAPISEQDPVTGRPGRSQAAAALASGSQAETPVYAVVLVIDNLPSIQARFGRRVADGLLRAYADFVAEILMSEDRLFRWSGPALLALLSRLDELDVIRSDFHAALERRKFQHVMRTSTRSIPLTISPRWTVLPVQEASAQLLPKIDSFVGALLTQE